ncbi:MAG: MATE family efflux transporter [Lachnospiraceae bacterium]|nr:MATE family efflux transporter [Lachnospiraceae bacterium]
MKNDLTKGSVTKTMLFFAAPMILGNLLQQFYNIADSLIVGQFLGADALAAVGSAYTLMTFLTSVLIGLCMGSGSLFSFYYGKKDECGLHKSASASFLFILTVTIIVNIAVFLGIDKILRLLQVPTSIYEMMREYVAVIFVGIFFIFLYNYFAYLLRAMGNSVTPLWFLGAAAILNVLLDLLFVVEFTWGIKGAAAATVIAQAVSGVGIGIYSLIKEPDLRACLGKEIFKAGSSKGAIAQVVRFSLAACIQQSVMNFGILMIQGLVNTFGTAVMAAFAAAVKIDTLAYMPAQEFANAYSIFIAQNYGAKQPERLKKGTKAAVGISVLFCLAVSAFVYVSAPLLMRAFVEAEETGIIAIGTGYLHIEGSFYWGIGLLFLLYGYFRGSGKPEMSIVLTVISLGSRVALAYILSPFPDIGVYGIWWAIPIGWILADAAGILFYINRGA